MTKIAQSVSAVFLASVFAGSAYSQSPMLPAGPKVSITAVTQPNSNFPQYTRVDVPILRDGVVQKSNGRIEVKLSSWPEMNLSGPRRSSAWCVPVRSISGPPPSTRLPVTCRFSTASISPGLLPDLDQAREVLQRPLRYRSGRNARRG